VVGNTDELNIAPNKDACSPAAAWTAAAQPKRRTPQQESPILEDAMLLCAIWNWMILCNVAQRSVAVAHDIK
jgi:hypothetical protein